MQLWTLNIFLNLWFAEKTQKEKLKAENDLKTFLLKKSQVLDKIKKQSAIIEQKKSEEQKEIKKFRTIAESKQKIIDEWVTEYLLLA